MKQSSTPALLDHKPEPRVHYEKIGDKEFKIEERDLHIIEEVALWNNNPRLIHSTKPTGGSFQSDADMEAGLRETPGYANLYRSIEDIGQMEPVYVWKRPEWDRYLVLEGATRVTILRELHRKFGEHPTKAKRPVVRARILPPEFGEMERVILLARIHVRRSGVRTWGRYIEAKFIWENVRQPGGLMTPVAMANHMGKSLSWVTRLRDAFEFVQKFMEHVDTDESEKLAVEHFSTLEEIAKSPEVGPKVRDYDNADHNELRAEVFDMVRNEVFKEYRDARYMREFKNDPEKWAQLKSHKKHIANELANDVKTNSNSLKAKVGGLEGSLERAIGRDPDSVNHDDLAQLQRAVHVVEQHLDQGVRPIRRAIVKFTKVLEEAPLADIRSVQPDELSSLKSAYDFFLEQVEKHKPTASA
jgi:hypothetical protein